MDTPVKYLTDVFSGCVFSVKPVQRRGPMQLMPGQNGEGYGDKISTDHVVTVNGKEHRVFCIQWSNAGSLYVNIKGEKYFLHGWDL